MHVTGSAVFRKKIGFPFFCLTAFLLLFLLSPGSAISVEADKPVEEVKEKATAPVVVTLGPEDEFDRGVPRTSVKRFLEAAKEGDYERAAQHLDLRNLPREMRNAQG